MPELPEVETVRRVLDGVLPGRRIQRVYLNRPKMLRGQDSHLFCEGLVKRRIRSVERRAKFLIFRLDKQGMLAHLGMSGQIFFDSGDSPLSTDKDLPDRHTHLVFDLDPDARLYFRDPRMFGRFGLLDSVLERALFERLGPEPLGPGFTARRLGAALAGRKAPVKALLLDQRIVPGMGNIYADESLHRAGIDPSRAGGNVSEAQVRRLHASVRAVLREAVHKGGTSLSDFLDPRHRKGSFQLELRVYGREGQACPECGTPVRKATVAQRGTHWCPTCQPKP